MSKIAKGIGKVFKAVVKVAKVVLPIALAVAAVVFTGGAALGLTPTFAGAVGSIVGGLGLSAPLAGALTGAVVGAGFGGATNFALSGGKLKALQKGALMGGIGGGLLGGLSPSTMGIGPKGTSFAANNFAARGTELAAKTAAPFSSATATSNVGGMLPETGGALNDLFGTPGSRFDPSGSATAWSPTKVPIGAPGGAPPGQSLAPGADMAKPPGSPAAPGAPATPGAPAAPGGMIPQPGTPAPVQMTVPQTTPVTGPASGVGRVVGGVGNFVQQNPMALLAGGQLVSSIFGSDGGPADQEKADAEKSKRLYDGVYTNPGASGAAGQYPGVPERRPVRRFRLNPETLDVEEVTLR